MVVCQLTSALIGTVKKKLENLSGSDSTQIVPPNSLARFLEIDNPRPFPPYFRFMAKST